MDSEEGDSPIEVNVIKNEQTGEALTASVKVGKNTVLASLDQSSKETVRVEIYPTGVDGEPDTGANNATPLYHAKVSGTPDDLEEIALEYSARVGKVGVEALKQFQLNQNLDRE
jgi:hypothetical protein